MKKSFVSGICAGILISIGGTVYLNCDNKYAGALLFSVALVCICSMGYSLFTGKVGFAIYEHSRNDLFFLICCLFGNAFGTLVSALAVKTALPAVSETALMLCAAKLEQSVPAAVIRAVFCGILMYLAVAVWRERKSYIGIVFCVPVFILSGFEHSIADMYYFFVSSSYSVNSFAYLLLIVFGNTLGGLLLPALGLLCEPHKKKQKAVEFDINADYRQQSQRKENLHGQKN